MSRTLPKRTNPLILSDVSPACKSPLEMRGRAAPHATAVPPYRSYLPSFFLAAMANPSPSVILDDELLARRRLGKTNLAVKPTLIGSSNATKPENLGVFEYAHLRAPLPQDLKGSEIFPSHPAVSHPETYFLMRRSKDGFVSATGMFKIAFPWAKTDEEKNEREYLKSREYTSQEEVAGNVWISPLFALELAREYQMYDWVRALLDPTDIVQSPSSAKKQITPPPKFDLPEDDHTPSQRRSRRSVSPSKKSLSPRKSRNSKSAKDVPSTPSTAAANNSLQEALSITANMESEEKESKLIAAEEIEVKTTESPKKKGRKSKKAAEAEEEKENEKEAKKEEKKTEKKKKKKEAKEKETEVEVTETTEATPKGKTSQTIVSLDTPISLPEVPSAAETEDMIAKAKEMVADAIKGQSEGSSSAKVTKKRKPEEDDEETAAESAQRVKKAKVLEDKLKRERVRNRALFGVSAAFALAASIPYFF
ncbi:uncharacterized protein N7498_008237 [Penicillium cinerascens]|uniref:Cell pattern formation-associated protein stuA n=1 Tax=Penicillium cinerascens TaxID=70096 RepID=A0A9W9MAK8_9EURO|nr:uncharacterized protein N7498_008237 [Penicillium cinerascens]KAJ5194799.1 hypothetical protein N7498_008237 [Penicillium cinerascens]